MASTIEQIDNYLKKNKKPLFTNLNKWFGEKKSNGSFVLDDDAKNLKSLWEDAQNAKGINNKISAFNKLKEELAHWSNPEELAKQEAELEEYGLDNWPELQDKLNMDQMRFFDQLSNVPETNKLDDLNIDDIYSQGYDFEQMKALADQYGYDYADKADRKEFLDKIYDYHKAKNVNEAFNPNDAAGIAVDFMLPVSKEYAKQNYEKINGITDMPAPLIADVATNAAMMGYGANTLGKPLTKIGVSKVAARNAANNMAAPLIREGSNIFINDKPIKDAAIDAGSTTVTNIATPYGLKSMYRWGNRLVQPEAKLAAKDVINQTADRVRNIEQKLKDGEVFRRQNYDGRFVYAKKDKKGNIINISNEEAAKAKDIIPTEDYEFYLKYKNIARSTTKKNLNQYIDEDVMKTGGKAKFENNLQEGKPKFDRMTPYEVADAADIKAKEGILHSIKNSNAWDRGGNYITNFQGQTKYATPALNAFTQMFGPLGEYVKIDDKKKLTDQELTELDMLQRLRELHKKNSTLFAAPKIPDKYKEYFDKDMEGQWDSDVNIRKIFGDR